jgi:cyanophycin synthetase
VSLAARVVGLDIAGVDWWPQDISRPLHAQGGAIVEVNAGPGLLMHLKPAVGAPRPVGRAIVDHLFPHAGRRRPHPHRRHCRLARQPPHRRLVAWLLHLSGRHVGLACQATACSWTSAASTLRIARNWEPATAC